MARAFNVASRRISAERVKRQLDDRFVGNETEYTAAGFGSGAVYIGGRVYQSNDVGVGVVKNVGRPAAAFYASAENGGSVVLAGGSGSSSSGGGGGTGSGDYLLRSGILPMLGNLDMGNRAIVNVALVDGRDVSTDGATLDGIVGASLLALSANTALANERVLVLSNAFAVTDGGAGGNYSVALATPGSLSATSINNEAGAHTHAVTASDNPGAAVSLLKSAADGNLTLTKLTTPLITTATNTDLVINPAGTGAVQFPNDQTLRTSSFDSSFPIQGWQINEVVGVAGYSSLTIGKIQADELAVRVFVADEVRVDRGDEFWTKSYGIVAETFTSPSSIGGTVSVKFEDSPALAGAIFVNNDWVLIRKLEIDTGITLFNLWGQVSTYVNNSDGTQNWTFTLRSGPTSTSITKGSLAIDFGASGAALIHLSVIDSAGAPYIKMRRWAGANPYTPANYTTYVQLGNLGSIGNAYYTPSGDGLYIRSTANEDQFMVADNNGFQIRGASFSLYNGSNQTVLMNNASGINLDEDVWGSWDNRRALQWWPDVSSMSGDPSLSIYTGKAVGGFTDQQNFSYIDANPTGGVAVGLSIAAFGEGAANDAFIYLQGGGSGVTDEVIIGATAITLNGITTMETGRADQFNPTSDLGADLGTTLLRWGTLYIDQIVVSGSISGDVLSGQEWEYPGSMVIDANSASNTTVTIVNQGTGTATLDVEGNITLAGTVDGVDIALFKSGYDSHVGNVNAHHSQSHVLATTSALGADHSVSGLSVGLVLRATGATTATFSQLQHSELGGLTTGDPHTQYLLRAGGNLTGNVTANTGVTIDGIDISVHAADINAHHAMQHDIASGLVHTITSATLGLVGATATNTVGVITPSANPGAAPAVLRTDNAGALTLVQLSATTKVQTPTIDSATGTVTLTGSTRLGQGGQWGAIDGPAVSGWAGFGTNFYYSGDTPKYRATNYASQIFFNNEIHFRTAPSGTLDTNITFVEGVRVNGAGAIGSPTYASQVTGWNISMAGAGDFRSLYTDQLHAKAFIADLEQALAGGQIISKSVAVLATSFTVPYAGGLQLLTVKDLPSAANMAVFQDNDIVRLRTFNRAGGSLTIGDCWGSVSGYTDNPDGTQTWSFLRSGLTTYTSIASVGTPTFATSASATSRTVNKPTGVAQNDLLLAVVTHDGAADVVTATGWTLLQYVSGSDINAGIYYKIAGASEPANYTFSTVNSHAIGASIAAYRNAYLSAPIDGYSIQANAAGSSMPAPAVWSTSSEGRAVFLGGVTNNSSATPPSGYTELVDSGATGIRVYVAEKQLIANGSTGVPSATISASFASVAALVVLRPAYTFMWTEAGGLTPGTIINADSLALDYGVSGNGYHEVNAIDGIYGVNSPYNQIVTWATHPATGQVVRTRTGNLYGLFGVANEYGFYAGDGGVAVTSQYMRVSNAGVQLNNIPIKLYNAGTQTVNINSAGNDIWVGPSSLDKRLSWNGTTLAVSGAITVSAASGFSGTGYLQVGSGTKDSTLSGWVIDSGEIVGQASGADKVVLSTDGKISVVGDGVFQIKENATTLKGYLYSSNPLDSLLVNSTGIGMKTNGAATAESISLRANALGGRSAEIAVEGTNNSGTNRIRMLAYSGSAATSGQMVLGESSFTLALSGTGTTDFSIDSNGGTFLYPNAGTSGLTVVTPNNQTVAGVGLLAADMGSSYGPHITIQRNNNASTPAAGFLYMVARTGTAVAVWVDNAGNLRLNTGALPTNANDTSGVVIGTQTSWVGLKKDIAPWTETQVALDAVLATPLYSYHLQADDRTQYHGLVITEEDRENDVWYGENMADNQTPSLNERNLFGYLIAAIQEQQKQISKLRERLYVNGNDSYQ